jgi:hypothetical protein
MSFYICDEAGNRLEHLGVVLRALRLGGMGLARCHSNDDETLAALLMQTLRNGGNPAHNEASYLALSRCVVEHAEKMPDAFLKTPGFSLKDQVEALLNVKPL